MAAMRAGWMDRLQRRRCWSGCVAGNTPLAQLLRKDDNINTQQEVMLTYLLPTFLMSSLYFNISFRSFSASSSDASTPETSHVTPGEKKPHTSWQQVASCEALADLCSAARGIWRWFQRLRWCPPVWCLRTLRQTETSLRWNLQSAWRNLQMENLPENLWSPARQTGNSHQHDFLADDHLLVWLTFKKRDSFS